MMDAIGWMTRIGRRMLMVLRRGTFDADLEEEMRLHQELREREQVERGVSPEEAHYAAERRFGNKLVLREESRDMWGWNWIETLLQDIRYGLRTLAKSPGFAAVALLTLALGIGANAAIFQLVDAVRLRTLPVIDPQSLAIIHLKRDLWVSGNFNGPYAEFTCPLWQQVRQQQQAFSSIAVWSGDQTNLATGGEMDIAHDI
jgi:hypothetical protein